jgi:sporulation protein YlmC with PRC-barrel domain
LEAIMTTERVADRKHTLIASDRIEGTAVRRTSGEKIGKIERLMLDKISGKVAYAVLSFGGFLGIGNKHLPIPWTRLTYNQSLDAYEINVSDDELRQAPAYEADENFDWGDRSREITIHRYYGSPGYWGY